MPTYLTDIRDSILHDIQKLIDVGRFRDVGEFVSTAIRNQLVLEESDERLVISDSKQGTGETDTADLLDSGNLREVVSREVWHAVSELQDPQIVATPTSEPLWGQYYRFFPLKTVMRVIASMYSDGAPPSLKAIRSTAIDEISRLSGALKLHDQERSAKGHLRLTVGFLKGDKRPKSQDRFITQYLGRMTASGALSGFLAEMGFAVPVEHNGDRRIALTAAGIAFACLSNPILDEGAEKQPLSSEEAQYLVAHITEHMAGEAAHMKLVLESLRRGKTTTSQLDASLEQFYKSQFPGQPFSDATISVMRAGAISRLRELGLIEPTAKGRPIRYELAPNWEDFLVYFTGICVDGKEGQL